MVFPCDLSLLAKVSAVSPNKATQKIYSKERLIPVRCYRQHCQKPDRLSQCAKELETIAAGMMMAGINTTRRENLLNAVLANPVLEASASPIAAVYAGTPGNDTYTGTSGADTADGAAGNDTLNGNAGNDSLFGGSGRDSLIGGDGNDVLNGGADTDRDTLIGGMGDDTYYGDFRDKFVEAAGGGRDLLYYAGNYNLSGSYIEDVVQTSTLNAYIQGNGLGNRLTGGTANDSLYGQEGSDTLTGNAGQDALSGGTGNDILSGGDGNDTLRGYEDNDSLNGDAGDDLLVGYAGDDTIVGGNGNDWLVGDAGNDTLIGGADNDSLEGGGGTNRLEAGAGNDTLITNGTDLLLGEAGNDRLENPWGQNSTLIGGAGNDTYVVVNISTATLVEASGEGIDEVISSVGGTLAANFENLRFGLGDGTGNGQKNMITGGVGANRLDGAAGADTLIGMDGNDTYVVDGGDVVIEAANGGTDLVLAGFNYGLSDFVEDLVLTGTANLEATGNGSSNRLTGNDGNNLLNGDGGNDTLVGGLGDDTYYVQSAGDVVIETAGQGKDLVVSWVSYALGGTLVENLTLMGPAGLSATGNSLGNTLTGNDGNNVLNGLGARDLLIGGLGADTFLFTASSGRDRINDFSAAQNDRVNINAYTAGVSNAAMVVQAGADVVITLTATDVITVLNTTRTDLLSHIVW